MGCSQISAPVSGIDTVAMGGIAASLPFDLRSFRVKRDGAICKRVTREQFSLFISFAHGRWQFRLQMSLPRVIVGNNFETIPVEDLRSALVQAVAPLDELFPELESVNLWALSTTRVDFAFDLPIEVTRHLLTALRDCYLSGRNTPGFIFRGRRTDSFYTKDSRGRRRSPSYRSLIAYGKLRMPSGRLGLRLESRLHSGVIRQRVGRLPLRDLAEVARELQRVAWGYIDESFEFLLPTTDEAAEMAVINSRDHRVVRALEGLMYFAQEVPLQRLAGSECGGVGQARKLLRAHGFGFGDPDRGELVEFANIRRAWSESLSCPYKNCKEWLSHNRLSSGA